MRSMSLLIVPLLLAGCGTPEKHTDGPANGTPITHVQLDLGMPDAISDRSGDRGRFYTPTNRPAAEWPWEAPRSFYYLDRRLVVTFVKGKSVDSREMTDAETAMVKRLRSAATSRPQ